MKWNIQEAERRIARGSVVLFVENPLGQDHCAAGMNG
jgi:hypothetical protein